MKISTTILTTAFSVFMASGTAACAAVPVNTPVDINIKQCASMNDHSFKCASWLAATTFLDLASDAETARLAPDACVEVLGDNLGAGLTGLANYTDGTNMVRVAANANTASCEGRGL
jgi:hypothetical protein